MAYDNESFIQKLRTNQVLMPEGKGLPSPLIGIPNFAGGGGGGFGPERVANPDHYGSGPGNEQPVKLGLDPWYKDQPNYKVEESPLRMAGSRIFGRTVDERQQDLEKQGPQYARIGVQQQNANTNSQKANILDYKAKNPNLQFKIPLGGNITAFDPATGQAYDTGIDSGTMTQEEKQQLMGSQRMEQIGAQGANRLEQIGAQARGKEGLETLKSGLKGSQGMTPGAFGSQQTNQIRELMMTRPDIAKYILKGENGQLQVDPNAPLSVVAELKQRLTPGGNNNSPAGDIELPSKGTPTTKTPTAGKPNPADLIKKYGG